MTRGFSLVELLVVFALLGLLASLGVARTTSQHDQVQLESGLRRLRVGLDRGRRAALRQREPCVLGRVGRSSRGNLARLSCCCHTAE